jgi:hypothetical protein
MYCIQSPPPDCVQLNSGEYKLFKYPPEKKHHPEYQNVRSVIYKYDHLVCFSPPKSISYDAFKSTVPIENAVIEPFIDGTMINLFYDDTWKITTKSVIGAMCTFESTTTFADLFHECMLQERISYGEFNTNYCYSFVMQHPKNMIVLPIEQPKLWLVAVYEIRTDGVYEQPIPFLKPPQFTFRTYDEVFHSAQSIFCKGYMLKYNGLRTKIRNNQYNTMAQIKGNVPFAYKFLSVRKTDDAITHFAYFPKDMIHAVQIEQEIDQCAIRLLEDYKNCFIHKRSPHREFPTKSYLYDLHGIYLNELKPRAMHKKRVVDYIDALPPPRLSCLLQIIRNRTIS